MAPKADSETTVTPRRSGRVARSTTKAARNTTTTSSTSTDATAAGAEEHVYTWQEVAKHNTQDDMWVVVADKVYDVTKWVDRHPGGVEMLRLVAGRDITVAFDVYHPFTRNHEKVLAKYEIGRLKEGSYEFPPYAPDRSGFYRDIKDEVGAYFRDNKIDPRDPWGGLWRMALVTAFSLCMYAAAFNPAVGDFTVSVPAALASLITAVAQVLQLPTIFAWLSAVLPAGAVSSATAALSGHIVSMTGVSLVTTADAATATAMAQSATITFPFESSCCLRIIAALLFGICQALPLLHVMHDCSHTSFGPNENWWYIAGRLYLDFYAGCSMTSWHNQHTIGHHIYTNIFKADPDMPKDVKGDIRRLAARQSWSWVCEFQHIYLPLLYGFLGISMRVSDVAEVFTKHTNGPMRVNPHGYWGHFEHIASKLFCCWWRVYLPLVQWHCPMGRFVLLAVLAELMTGYWLAFNFQVSHISDVATFPLHDKESSEIELEWAVAQTVSSVDYSRGDWWTTFCCGALNYQIEHHLLPSVSQYHYPAIAPIVQRICRRHGVRYNQLPDFYSAFYHHLCYLRILGKNGQFVPLEMSLH